MSDFTTSYRVFGKEIRLDVTLVTKYENAYHQKVTDQVVTDMATDYGCSTLSTDKEITDGIVAVMEDTIRTAQGFPDAAKKAMQNGIL